MSDDFDYDPADKTLKESVQELLDTYESRQIFLSRQGDGSVDMLEWFNATDQLLHKLAMTVAQLGLRVLEDDPAG